MFLWYLAYWDEFSASRLFRTYFHHWKERQECCKQKSSMNGVNTARKMKFSFKDFFSKCDQIRSFLRIWSHLLKKSSMGNFIFCAV